MVHCLFRVLEQSTACTYTDHKTTGPSLCFYVIICDLLNLCCVQGSILLPTTHEKLASCPPIGQITQKFIDKTKQGFYTGVVKAELC